MISHTTLDISLSIILGLAAIPCGMFFGALPIRNEDLTPRQQSASSIIGVVVLVIAFALIFTHYDIASWIFILALIIFFFVAKIPAVHQWMIKKWPKIFSTKRKRRK